MGAEPSVTTTHMRPLDATE